MAIILKQTTRYYNGEQVNIRLSNIGTDLPRYEIIAETDHEAIRKVQSYSWTLAICEYRALTKRFSIKGGNA